MSGANNNEDQLDLRLGLGYSDKSSNGGSRMKGDDEESGAGVNAGRRGVDMTFAASDPLSELVWSPHKGLSLKCTCSDKTPFVLWNVGTYPPSETNIFEGVDDDDDEGKGKLLVTEAMSRLDMEDAHRIHLSKYSSKKNKMDNASGNQNLGLGLTVSSGIHSSRKLGPLLNLIPQQESNEKATYVDEEEESKGKREHLENKESSGENDKQKLITKEVSEENEKSKRRKGKEKVFVGGNANNSKMSSNEEDSHESVDSCNSAKMLPRGKRRLPLEEEQPLLVGGKRVKTQMHGQTNVGHDSSFMTWISNMVNGGHTNVIGHEEAPLPLSLAHSLAKNGTYRGEIVTYGKDHDVERKNTFFQAMPEPIESKQVILPNHGEIVTYDKDSKNMGFQSMFRSLFRPPSEKRISKDDPPTREFKEVKMITKASPISCHRESKVYTSSLAHRDGISTKFPIKPLNVDPKWDSCQKSTSTDKKSSGKSSSRKETEGGGNKKSSGNSLSRKETGEGNNSGSTHPSESKAVQDLADKSVSPAGSLWISRFCVKDNHTAVNLDEFDLAPDLVENVLIGKNLFPSSPFGSNDIGGIPKGAFDAIRRISLSRGTILKWINSKSSMSHLDGFFLRLRIGKQDDELGRTGYYVARIAGTQKESPTTDSKKFIPVSVGGIKCFIGCQYVSNHGFLEDELLAWWWRTLESGGKVPSEDELRLKLEEKIKLGL